MGRAYNFVITVSIVFIDLIFVEESIVGVYSNFIGNFSNKLFGL